MTLGEARKELSWEKKLLAERAGISTKTALQAEKGELITPRTARKIAEALSQALGRTITPGDIEGLNVRV